MKLSVLAIALLLTGCATTHGPVKPDVPSPIAEPEPTLGSLLVTLDDYAECFVERTADAIQGRLVIGPCP
jgi:hypothetical protein